VVTGPVVTGPVVTGPVVPVRVVAVPAIQVPVVVLLVPVRGATVVAGAREVLVALLEVCVGGLVLAWAAEA
jgi:hypothetical protein